MVPCRPTTWQDIPAQTLRQRPDVRAAEHRVAAAAGARGAGGCRPLPGFFRSAARWDSGP